MRTLYIIGVLLCITFFSCKKKTDDPSAVTNQYGDAYLSASSGWQRVATVKNSSKYSMRAYDLQIDGSNARVLYSEGFTANGADIQTYYKAQYALGSNTEAAITKLPDDYTLYIQNNSQLDYQNIMPQFQPGTFNTEYLCFYHYYSSAPFVNLNDNNLKQVTTDQVNSPTQTFKNLPNGDILGGDVANTRACVAEYYTRSNNSWKAYYANAYDGSAAYTHTPFILADGTLLSFRLYYKTGKAYLAIADFTNANYPASGFANRVVEEHTEFAPNIPDLNSIFFNPTNVVAYTTEANSVTIVMQHKDILGQTSTLSAYKWTEGATTIQKLYSGVSISNELVTMLLRRNEIGCTIDGTLYAILSTGTGFHLSLTNSGGEKSYGAASNNNGGNYVLTLNRLRYYNGSYYAVLAPTQGGTSPDAQHMDIVKLTP